MRDALRLLGRHLGKFFLNASGSSGVAAAWLGRALDRPVPSSAAMDLGAFFAVQTPPSSGGRRTGPAPAPGSPGVGTVGAAPFPRHPNRLDS
jgi:hypothetical protein